MYGQISIMQCYAPTEDADCAVKDEVYAQLTATLSAIQRGDITFLMDEYWRSWLRFVQPTWQETHRVVTDISAGHFRFHLPSQ